MPASLEIPDEATQAADTEVIPGGSAADAPTEAIPLLDDSEALGDSALTEPTTALPTVDLPAAEAPPAELAERVPESLAEDEPSRRSRRGLWISLVLVAVAVLGVGGYLIWDNVTKSMRDEAVTATAQTYLQGISDGDVAMALGTLAEQPADSTLLTNEVLATSVAAQPITNATVDAITTDGETATADVSYTIGDTEVAVTLDLVGDGRTSWHITDGLADLTLTSSDALTINGAAVDQLSYPVLPGSYTAAPVTDLISLGDDTTVLINDPLGEGATISPAYSVSEAGRETILSTLKADIDRCLASTESVMDGCPFGIDPGETEVKAGSVRFELTNDPWADFAAELDPTTLTATGTVTFTIDATASVTFDGRTNDAAETTIEADRTWAVDLTQEPMIVAWTG